MKLAKVAALGFGACLIVVVVGASAVLKVLVDVIEGPNQRYVEPDWPA